MKTKSIEQKVLETIEQNKLIEKGDKMVLRSIWRTRFHLYVRHFI